MLKRKAAIFCDMASRSITPFQAFLMVLLIVFWGSSFVVVKQVLGEGLTPTAVATFRFLVAGAFFLIALFIKKRLSPDYQLRVERKDLLTMLALALTGVTFFFTIQYTGIQLAGASIAAVLVCLLSPILITVFSARLFGEHLRKRQITGIITAMAGTLLVVSADLLNLQGNMKFLVGTLILLSTPVMWAVYSLIGEKIMKKYDAFLVVAYVSLLGGLCLIPFSLADNSFFQIFTLGTNEWLAILYLSFTCSLLGYYIWFYVLKKAGATASSFLFAEPLVTVVFAVIFINETLYPSVLAGAVLIFIGVLLVTAKNS
ncbi:MAG: EamA family transporter [Candidatus Bathyarchaeota archaeon]|nr:EamA family transporter [Candidatus Bathyarchaeota archaeon]